MRTMRQLNAARHGAKDWLQYLLSTWQDPWEQVYEIERIFRLE